MAASGIKSFYLNTFLLEVVSLDPYYTSVVLLFGQVVDAITAPIIGKLSDNMNTRIGRRRPWLLIAPIFLSIAYICLWQTWVSGSQEEMLAYFLGIIALANIAENGILVPYSALTPEISNSYDQATKLTELRVMFGLLFLIVCTTCHSFIIESFTDSNGNIDLALGYKISAIIFGIIFAIFPILSGLFLKERTRTIFEKELDTKRGLIDNLKDLFSTMKNRNFICCILMYLLSWTAVNFVTNNLFLYFKYVIRQEDLFKYMLIIMEGCAALSAFIWGKIALGVGKKKAFIFSQFQSMFVGAAVYVLDESTHTWIIYIIAVMAGMTAGASFLLPWTMLPDIIDEDESKTGKRREGAFYSLIVLIQRIGLATALATSSSILGLYGYVSPNNDDSTPDIQPQAVVEALRIIIGITPASLHLLSILPMIFYKLDREDVAKIKLEIQKTKQEQYS